MDENEGFHQDQIAGSGKGRIRKDRLRKSLSGIREDLSDIMNTLPVGICLLDKDGAVAFANARAEEILRLKRSAGLGLSYNDPAWKIADVDGGPFLDEELPFSRVLSTGSEVRGVEHTIVHPDDGRRVILSIDAAPLLDSEGRFVGMIASLVDVTEHRRMENDLKESEHRYRELFENIHSGVAIYEARRGGGDFVIKDFNRAAERIDRVGREEVIGKSVLEAFPGVRDFGLFEVLQRVWRSGQPEQFPIAQYRDERIEGWRENYVYKLPTGEIVAIYEDVTQRKQFEFDLLEHQALIQRIMDATPNIIYIYDLREGRNICINRRVVDLLGYSPEEIWDMGDSIIERTVHPEDREKVAEFFGRFVDLPGEGALELEYRHLTVDGETRWFHSHSAVFSRDGEGRATQILGEVQDVTERKMAEERLSLLNQCLLNLGADPEENIERIIHDALEILEGHLVKYWRSEGEHYVLYSSSGMEGYRHEPARMKREFMERYFMWHRGPIAHGNGEEPGVGTLDGDVASLGLRSLVGFPVMLREDIVGCICAYDLVEREFDEEEMGLMGMLARAVSIEEERSRVEKGLRDFIDIVSHELRHPITVMKGYAVTMKEYLGKLGEEESAEMLEAIERGADRMVGLLGELLDTTRIERGRFVIRKVEVPLAQVLEAAEAETIAKHPTRNIVIRVQDGIESLTMDPAKIGQVLVALLDNAAKFSPERSDIEVEASRVENEVEISVLDRGKGVPVGERDRIFERFYQVGEVTHHSTPGIGLGLYISRQIVEAHGGRMWYEPRDGGGSAFHFTLTLS